MDKSKRFSIWLYFLFAFPCMCWGQVAVTTTQVLGTAKQQSQFQLQERKLDFLKNTSHELPLINRWEFRTQTHDLDLSEQRFTFRIRPNSRKERNGQRQLHFSTIQYYKEETRTVLLEGIQKRYNACLALLFAQKRKQLMLDLEEVYRQLGIAYEKAGDFEELIDSEEHQQIFSLQLFDYQQEVEKSIRKIQYYLSDKSIREIQNIDFLSISQLNNRIESINRTEPIANPALSLLENKINLVEKELSQETAKQKKWLSFAQMRYGGRDPLSPFNETFSLAFAFQIPVKGNSLLKTNKLSLDKITAENEWGKAHYYIDKERKNLIRELFNWLEKYEQLTKNLAVAQERLNSSYAVKTADYEVLSLKIRAHLLKKKLRLHQVEEKIYQTYIDWLAVTGKMIELPLVNYLTVDLERF